MLCRKTNRTLELHQNGVLVNLFYDYEFEQEEIEKLLKLKPVSLHNISGNKKALHRNMSRNFFEKHYIPSNLDLDTCRLCLPVPPEPSSSPVKLARYTNLGPNIYIGGRYRKISRDLSQTPWILNGKRMKEDSVQEIICNEICPYFGVEPAEQNEKVIFMGSGREDVDVCSRYLIFLVIIGSVKKIYNLACMVFFQVRCLGKGKENDWESKRTYIIYFNISLVTLLNHYSSRH